MAEIRALKPCGLKVASTFSGGGGSSCGYKMAGLSVVWANEFIESARETYAANFPDTILDARDIRKIEPGDVLKAIGMKAGELDVFDGSPPCASFSTAGKREKGWGTVKKYSDGEQRSDDLFFEYARLVRGIQPRAFVAENVSGLVKGTAKGYFKMILRELESCGYVVRAKLLDAQWLGVPQQRQRIIFVGVRKDLGVEPAHPDPLSYRYSVRDALPHLARVVYDTSGAYAKREVIDRASPAITVSGNAGSFHHKVTDGGDGEGFERYAIFKEWEKLKPGESSKKYFNLVRPREGSPSPTVTAEGGKSGAAGVTAPYGPRKYTIAELKSICSFPPDFELRGTYSQQWERCGRAVPPLMMRAVAAAVRDGVFGKLKKKAR